jgi:hypothetical protein
VLGFLEFVNLAFLGLRLDSGSARTEGLCQEGFLGTEATFSPT